MQDRLEQFVIQRVRGQKQRVGVMIGSMDAEGQIRIGWSRANISAGDIFDRKKGISIAEGRSKANAVIPIPQSMAKSAYHFQDRCQRYFKNATSASKITIRQD